MLTAQQLKLHEFICAYYAREGVAPSYDEMAEAINLSSRGNINRLMSCLIERGYIRKIPYRARAIEILRYPDGTENFQISAQERKLIEYCRANPAAFDKIKHALRDGIGVCHIPK